MRNFGIALLTFALFFTACKSSKETVTSLDDGKIEVVFLQVNDVYEIAGLDGGKEGGMARVAAVKKQLLAENPNTFLVVMGDFLSPSVYNSLKFEGERIRGKQMVAAMNAAGMDYAIFGNHEFDIKEAELQSRINESEFTWISSNTFHQTEDGVKPFVRETTPNDPSFAKTEIIEVTDADGTTAKIGVFGVCLPFNKVDYVHYTDPIQVSKEMYNELKDQVDIVVAFTHLDLEDDIKLAQELPELGLIMGGHEHDMKFEKIGDVYITKANANAKSAYINKMTIDVKAGTSSVKPELKFLDESIPHEPATKKVVDQWMDIANNSYSSLGFNANEIILSESEPLEGRETVIRSQSTNLTKHIVKAMEAAAPKADAVFVNGGAIRVDDIVNAPLSQYDILRAMPFGGSIREADAKGSVLIQVLEAGLANKGKGGFLHYNENISKNGDTWLLAGTPIESEKIYRVATLDFVFSGYEMNLGFFKEGNPDIVKVYPEEKDITHPLSDIRLAVVQYFKSLNK